MKSIANNSVNQKNNNVTPFAVAKAAPFLFSSYDGR